ncbi:hypothetical protein D8674_020910 [Pyrus ussuriensis x Pyrus communis]|uniref:CCHC-type domain-containing protein n=1 Tax=Pyrus ussuriensis x Pyrus communis TaxID=2448454 RepID=A0A5N5HMC0_9ROSA|nr:hypothetical protein D8674_020910 [Pyrus ussuriensis x Pyrus communis]
MPRTGDATSFNPRAPHDEDMAKVLQAIKQMASLALEGTSGIDQRLKFLKVFISLSPPQYAGNPDEPLEGVEWLERIKQCFDVSDVPEDLKVGNAKCEEFLRLTQGNMTVAQYESKFLQLSRHAPHLVRTDEQRAEKFLMGLRPSIGSKVAVIPHDTYLKVRAAALLVERSFDILAEQESFEGASSAGEKRPRKQYICHHCGEPGHIRPNCPEFQPPSPSYPY